ncbi:hypothetical protein Hanom_Chr06g00520081 [Helianthus anomalus]
MTPVSEELFFLSSDDSLGSDSSVCVLSALGAHPAAAESGKAQKTKRQEKPATLVSKQTGTGIFRPRKTPSEDYVLVSDTLEGLYILGATFGTGSADTSTGVLTKVTLAPVVEGSGSSNLERPNFVKKRKLMSMPASVPLKKPILRLQKTTDLDAHEVHASAVATTMTLPPPPSPPNMPVDDEERVKEPEHAIQVEKVVEDAPSHEAEVRVDDEPVVYTTVADDIIDLHNNIIDTNINQGSTGGGGAHV